MISVKFYKFDTAGFCMISHCTITFSLKEGVAIHSEKRHDEHIKDQFNVARKTSPNIRLIIKMVKKYLCHEGPL